MGPSHKQPKQLVLFGRAKQDGLGNTPGWRSLPLPTRQKAVSLLARLFIEHCRTPATEEIAQIAGPGPEEDGDV